VRVFQLASIVYTSVHRRRPVQPPSDWAQLSCTSAARWGLTPPFRKAITWKGEGGLLEIWIYCSAQILRLVPMGYWRQGRVWLRRNMERKSKGMQEIKSGTKARGVYSSGIL